MIEIYKDHEIKIAAMEMNSGWWRTNIGILWTDSGKWIYRPCTIKGAFKTDQLAIEYALALVKKWIDDGRPLVTGS